MGCILESLLESPYSIMETTKHMGLRNLKWVPFRGDPGLFKIV